MITTTSDDPILRARQVYTQEPCARNFEEDLYLHLNTPGSIVYKDAGNLALVRPIDSKDEYHRFTNPAVIYPTADCWWVYLLVGDFRFLVNLLPYPLPLIGWERDNVPRFYDLQTLKQHLQ